MTDAPEVSEEKVPAKVPEKPVLESGGKVQAFIPQSVDDLGRLADAFIAAGMVPESIEGKDVKETKAKVMVTIMKGLEVAMGPVTALSTIMVINKRAAIYGDGAVALCLRSGQVDWMRSSYQGEIDKDDWTALFEIKRKGQEKVYRGTFSVADAKRAHLWLNVKKKPWMEYPQRMLMNRARAFALRDGFADCLMGLSIAEEVQDYPALPAPVATDLLDDTIIDQPPTEQPQ